MKENITGRSTVVRVGLRVITLARYVSELRLQLLLDRDRPSRERANLLPFELLRTLASEELVRQLAGAGYGLELRPKEIDAAFAAHIGANGMDPDSGGKLREVLRVTGLSRAEYRTIVAQSLLTESLGRLFAGAPRGEERLLRAHRPGRPEPLELGWMPDRLLARTFRGPIAALRPAQRTRPITFGRRRVSFECLATRREDVKSSNGDLEHWLRFHERVGHVEYHFDSDRYAYTIARVDDLLGQGVVSLQVIEPLRS